MKPSLVLALLIGVPILAGCDSLDEVATNVREQFSQQAPVRSKTFNAPPRVVYDAVREAAKNMGYRFVRGGPAEGRFQAVSEVAAGDTNGSARQTTMRINLHPNGDETATEVEVRFAEIIEADSSSHPGMATETTMRNTPLYEVLFRNIQDALSSRETAKSIRDVGAPVKPR